jgi:hypothetical protein
MRQLTLFYRLLPQLRRTHAAFDGLVNALPDGLKL